MCFLSVFVEVVDVFICLVWFVGWHKKLIETPLMLLHEENTFQSFFCVCFPTGKKASGYFETHDVEETER